MIDKLSYRQTDRKAKRKSTDKQLTYAKTQQCYRQTDKNPKDIQTNGHIDRQTGSHIDRQTSNHLDRQTDRSSGIDSIKNLI